MSGETGRKFEALVATMHRLRAPGGCPWDAEQTHLSLKPYVIEEAHEVCDAIDRGDYEALRDELGDLLLQVLFHAELASERAAFDVEGVVERLQAKLVRRHPHVFGGLEASSSKEVLANWSRIKREERENSRTAAADGADGGALAGVPRTMPALLRAHRLGERAAAVGFDWRDLDGVRAKLQEELDEFRSAESAANLDAIRGEIGDVLFTVASYARHFGANAEMLLHGTLDRFQRRFAQMEADLVAAGTTVDQADAATLDRAWHVAKSKSQ